MHRIQTGLNHWWLWWTAPASLRWRLRLAGAGVVLAWVAVEWQRVCFVSALKPEHRFADLLNRDGLRWLSPQTWLPDWLPWLSPEQGCLLRDAHGWALHEVLSLPEHLWRDAVHWVGYWPLFLLLAASCLLLCLRPKVGSEIVLRTAIMLALGTLVLVAGHAVYTYIGANNNQTLNFLLGAIALMLLVSAGFLVPSGRFPLYRRIELATLLGGGFLALATAGFLLNEYEDQRQARVTRAWDLLHKARAEAYRRMNAAEAKELARRQQIVEALEAAHKNDCSAAPASAPCETILKDLDDAKANLARLINGDSKERWKVREPARGGNDGQIGALYTLVRENVDLTGLKVDELYLGRLQLPKYKLQAASFRNADLSGANLTGAFLWSADLRGANLTGANLRGANLRGADLRGADLTVANLRGADLSGARFSAQPKSLGARWVEAKPPTNLDKIIIVPNFR